MNKYALIDQIFEAVIVVDSVGGILHFNHMMPTLSKLPPRKLSKMENITDMFASLDGKIDISSEIKECLESKKTIVSKEGEIRFSGSNEIANVVLKLIPLENELLICINDLSIEKNLFNKYKTQVAELKDSYKKLIHADKLKSLGELTAGISHEISNPLTIASGSTELLEIFLESGLLEENMEEVTEAIENIQSSLLRINKITLNMKKFVYQDDEKKEYFNLASVISSSIDLVKPSFDKEDIEIEFKELSPGTIGFVNELGIEQVLVNLLKNSLDASRNSSSKSVTVELDTSKDGESVFIRVKDLGHGISDENIDQVFNPFFTTKEMGEGTGMGLSLSRQIIEAHQGTLTCISNGSKGSTFTIELPGVELSSYLENESQISNLEGASELKVLVIDNEVSVLNLFSSLFKDENFSVIGSSKPSEALKLIDKVAVDIIIADYNMPELNATQLATEIRSRHIDTPIVYLTSKDFSHKFDEDKNKLQISSLVLKPFTKQSVLDAIYKITGDSSENL
ncbi:hybrid sensor histidine kinase/response regulator [Halobacteriovorax sp. HLS]|uniref:hybrid sensor histidine kinase/response regulator n=1 Tax=Halobacteriovorax sp. HLS TaxID=2234000 RepID=UPI000FDC6C6C|nr:hybrid sensor histidine kinase/response regulator [Halobacteriovorax sp. HLS]